MMTAQKKKMPIVPSARPRTISVHVAHPTLPLTQEQVQRVVDSIEAMRKRKQIDYWQHRAAERIKAAHDVIYGSIGGTMDMDRVRGVGLPGSPPPLAYLEAAQTMGHVKQKLYSLDHRVISLVVCDGHSIKQAAAIIYRIAVVARKQEEEIGRRLRAGLDQMAMLWWGHKPEVNNNQGRIVSHHTDDVAPSVKPYTASAGIAQRGHTVHATGHKIFRGD